MCVAINLADPVHCSSLLCLFSDVEGQLVQKKQQSLNALTFSFLEFELPVTVSASSCIWNSCLIHVLIVTFQL